MRPPAPARPVAGPLRRVVLAACALCAACAPGAGPAAGRTAASPAAPGDLARRVADAERAFADSTRLVGVRDGFLAFIADTGVVLGPGGPAGRAELAAGPRGGGTLVWRPALVLASAAGDLGVSTGPGESRPAGPGNVPLPPRHSQFATIWHRQPDGRWRFLVDVGVNVPAPAPGMPQAGDAGAPRVGAAGSPGAAPAGGAAAVDGAYTAAAAADWPAAAAAAYAPDVRLLRDGRYPIDGAAAVDSVRAWGGPLVARVAAGGVAASGDLAWVRGTWTLGDARGNLLRAWRRAPDGTWRVVLEVLSAAPPPRTSAPATPSSGAP